MTPGSEVAHKVYVISTSPRMFSPKIGACSLSTAVVTATACARAREQPPPNPDAAATPRTRVPRPDTSTVPHHHTLSTRRQPACSRGNTPHRECAFCTCCVATARPPLRTMGHTSSKVVEACKVGDAPRVRRLLSKLSAAQVRLIADTPRNVSGPADTTTLEALDTRVWP